MKHHCIWYSFFYYSNYVIFRTIICKKSETIERVYHIYAKNISELENAEKSELRSRSENVQLRNTIDEKNYNIPLDSECSNNEDGVK